MLHPKATVYGLTVMKIILQGGSDLGCIEGCNIRECVDADFVIVSVPVDVALVLPEVLDLIGENTIVFEVGSTKTLICEAVTNHPKRVYRNTSNCGTEFSVRLRLYQEGFKGKQILFGGRTAFKLQEKALDLLKPSG
jgi:prephenate dehydrogenase